MLNKGFQYWKINMKKGNCTNTNYCSLQNQIAGLLCSHEWATDPLYQLVRRFTCLPKMGSQTLNRKGQLTILLLFEIQNDSELWNTLCGYDWTVRFWHYWTVGLFTWCLIFKFLIIWKYLLMEVYNSLSLYLDVIRTMLDTMLL